MVKKQMSKTSVSSTGGERFRTPMLVGGASTRFTMSTEGSSRPPGCSSVSAERSSSARTLERFGAHVKDASSLTFLRRQQLVSLFWAVKQKQNGHNSLAVRPSVLLNHMKRCFLICKQRRRCCHPLNRDSNAG